MNEEEGDGGRGKKKGAMMGKTNGKARKRMSASKEREKGTERRLKEQKEVRNW